MRLRYLMAIIPLLALLHATAQEVLPRRGCRMGVVKNDLQRKVRRARSSNRDVAKYTGERHQLTVLVAFADKSFKGDEESTLAQWDKIFNAKDYSETPFSGSIHDYFYDQSYGQFNLTFDLHYVTVDGMCKNYRSTENDDENSKYLINDIVDELQNRDIDWSRYDWDDDGYVDQLLVIYAGKGMNAGGGTNTIWPHQWWLSEHLSSNYRTVSQGNRNYRIDCYCCVQEQYSDGGYGVFGMICHEYTHCFGFPDFYYGNTSFPYKWELMDFSCYNGGGFLPGGYSAHERMLMGWLTPTELTEPATVSRMKALSEAPEAYLIRNAQDDHEYYIVENRQQTGWDRGLPGSGIIVFHINYDEEIWNSISDFPNEPDSPNKRYYIIPANNLTRIPYCSGWAYPYQGNNMLTDTSTPAAVVWNGESRLMSKPITEMKVTNGLASFKFMDEATAISATTKDKQKAEVLYQYGPVSIMRHPDGQVKKVVSRQTKNVANRQAK